jgi:S-adenosylmethionine:tRNA ribosyltransferase-isomerase
MDTLSLADFHYHLPDELIAQQPLADRSASRLLVHQADGTLDHRRFQELPDILPRGTRLVFNDTRVLPSRLEARTAHGGRIELMLLQPLDASGNRWQALGRPFRKLNPGTRLTLEGACEATIEAKHESGAQPSLEVSFNLPYEEFLSWMEAAGYIPLPPYITRKEPLKAPESLDRERYQTIYAREKGSVAAPTAGLHFNNAIWDALKAAGIIPVPITLHVGGGTFLPVKTQDITAHAMHSERYRVSRESWTQIQEARHSGHPLVVVGTTSLRCLESFARRVVAETEDHLLDRWLETSLFLYPKHKHDRIRPWGVQGIITNFHQPESSLLMLVASLIGYEAMRSLYVNAVEERYRFLSYGDASLLWLPK